MNQFSWTHLADAAVKHELAEVASRHNGVTAELLAGLAEFAARKLYAPAGYASMHAYCVDVLRMSQESAYKRIRVAKTAREFPVLFTAIAEGRLNLSAVLVLTPHLNAVNAEELVAAASGKSRTEIELLLAERFPRPDVQDGIAAVVSCNDALILSPGTNLVTEAEQTVARAPRAKVTPIAPQRFAFQCTLGQAAYEKLRYAQALAGHVEGHDLPVLFVSALDAFIAKEERRKFAVTSRPGKRRASGDTRYVPAEVMRKVYQRDGGRCTFVGEGGHRCDAREGLEFDHEIPVARGGRSTFENVRLRCHAHNQYEAERLMGAEFMAEKRRAAQERSKRAKASKAEANVAQHDDEAAIVAGLRRLGLTASEAKETAHHCIEALPNAPIEQRMLYAMKGLAPRCTRIPANELRGATT